MTRKYYASVMCMYIEKDIMCMYAIIKEID